MTRACRYGCRGQGADFGRESRPNCPRRPRRVEIQQGSGYRRRKKPCSLPAVESSGTADQVMRRFCGIHPCRRRQRHRPRLKERRRTRRNVLQRTGRTPIRRPSPRSPKRRATRRPHPRAARRESSGEVRRETQGTSRSGAPHGGTTSRTFKDAAATEARQGEAGERSPRRWRRSRLPSRSTSRRAGYDSERAPEIPHIRLGWHAGVAESVGRRASRAADQSETRWRASAEGRLTIVPPNAVGQRAAGGQNGLLGPIVCPA